MLTALIDTNVMMVALSPKSNLHGLYRAFIRGDFTLVVSSGIIPEYEEQLRLRYSDEVVAPFLLILSEANNVRQIEPHFKWALISQDPDDNKFCDAYIAAASDYLVTHNRHFDILKRINFPLISVADAYSFFRLLSTKV